jgi:hypothetical protein
MSEVDLMRISPHYPVIDSIDYVNNGNIVKVNSCISEQQILKFH